MSQREKILEIRDLNISFKTGNKNVKAIRGVNLDLYKGETIAIVGESGSGKSVTTKAIMGILAKNGAIDSGSINYTWHDEKTGWGCRFHENQILFLSTEWWFLYRDRGFSLRHSWNSMPSFLSGDVSFFFV